MARDPKGRGLSGMAKAVSWRFLSRKASVIGSFPSNQNTLRSMAQTFSTNATNRRQRLVQFSFLGFRREMAFFLALRRFRAMCEGAGDLGVHAQLLRGRIFSSERFLYYFYSAFCCFVFCCVVRCLKGGEFGLCCLCALSVPYLPTHGVSEVVRCLLSCLSDLWSLVSCLQASTSVRRFPPIAVHRLD